MPTREEIAAARVRVAGFIDAIAVNRNAPILPEERAAMRTLLAATEPASPLPADGSGWCQMCEKHGLYAEHQCFFGPVKP